ncbi:MAG: glycosyltransferase family 4 protein [Vicinamibacterales bacterium]
MLRKTDRSRRLKIAQVAPLSESVPPKLYGGTERVVAYLTDELVRQGHDVTLFASGDSQTSARLLAACPRALRLGGCREFLAPHLVMLEQVVKRAHEFDVIHFHIGLSHYPLARRLPIAHLTTLHGRLDLPELVPLYHEYCDMSVVSISQAQRRPLPHARWVATIHHGLPPDELRFHQRQGEYLAFLGRISPEKRVDRAIAIAKACGWPIRIAAKVDPADAAYFECEVRRLLDHPLVEFIGEIGEREKSDFLGGAKALLFPIDWPEPFGLVMIEALACGTPVVAFRHGSVPEIIDPGVTGFIVDNLDQAIEATRRVGDLSRAACRREFERRFTVMHMASAYTHLYGALASETSTNLVA